MRFVAAVFAPFLILLSGCLSAPLPQELVDRDFVPAPKPLRIREIVRLSDAGIGDEVIVELIRIRGVADRPGAEQISMLRVSRQVRLFLLASPAEAPERKPVPTIVYRELFIPLWPSYAGGRWHLGLRMGCYYRIMEKEVQEIVPQEAEAPVPQPQFVDP